MQGGCSKIMAFITKQAAHMADATLSLWRESVAEDVSMCDDRDNLFENDGDV